LGALAKTPLHPQWLVYRHERGFHRRIGALATGVVLDIGAGRQNVRRCLNPECRYLSIDYYDTAVNWYKTLPAIFADAQALPIKSASIDTVLLLDVMEHLPRPQECLGEINRVLKNSGQVILQVPFLYPIHDAPLDFQRWTRFGLERLVARYGFTLRHWGFRGTPIESAMLLMNIAYSKAVLTCLQRKSPLALLGLLLPLVIVCNHLLALLSRWVMAQDSFMPLSYHLTLIKE
jgi:SAM-dependent methyltransferase